MNTLNFLLAQSKTDSREAARLRTVLEVGRKVTSILDLDQLLIETIRLIKDFFGYDLVSVHLLDQHDPDYFYHVMCSDFGCECLQGQRRRSHISQGMVGWVLRNQQSRLANDVTQDPYYLSCVHHSEAELDIPLKFNETCIGVLTIESPRLNAFDPDDVPVLEILADQIATAIENARLTSRAREAAIAEERNRLARELHDNTVQTLAGINRQLDLLRCDISDALGIDACEEALPDPVERRLNKMQDSLEEVIQNLRLVSRDLRPQLLQDFGLREALDSLVSDLCRSFHVEISIRHEGEPYRLRADQELNFYRITQEALSNVMKHACATQVKLLLAFLPNEVILSIEDNGKGFDVPQDLTKLARTGGMGVINMRQRIREIGGCLRIESAPGQGTSLIITLPTEALN
jgi:signal transduction histidine kinase